MSVGIGLAIVCVGTLVFFVGHTASRINVDTVVDLVSDDLTAAIVRLTSDVIVTSPLVAHHPEAITVTDARSGYLQHLDGERLADWAAAHGVRLQLLVRPGDFVFPGATIALVGPPVDGAAAAINAATALGAQRVSDEDLEFAVRQLVEVAVRALSPGINDPHTALSVLDRMGAALCRIAPRHLASGQIVRDGRVALIVPEVDYDGLVDAMFHMIRQNAAGSTAVLIRLIEVLTAVAGCERDPVRLAVLARHAGLARADGMRDIANPADAADLDVRHARFVTMIDRGPACLAL